MAFRKLKIFPDFNPKFLIALSFLLLSTCTLQPSKSGAVEIGTPESLYGDLFYEVQSSTQLFEDSKTFVDCKPLATPQQIRSAYAKLAHKDQASLSVFVKKYFQLPDTVAIYKTDSSSINTHIFKLWNVLMRPADPVVSGTLIPLPNSYVVPGGRFREIYYWDSYFTMLGLEKDGQVELIEDMVDNFSYLIDTHGSIPNGNRTYYLSRSQPPFYSLMIDLLANIKGDSVYSKHLTQLQREYDFWMDGVVQLHQGKMSYRRVVLMPGAEVLNRYWDDKDSPRPESYHEDLKTAKAAVAHDSAVQESTIYRHIRAAAESGWDFSSRWFQQPNDLYSIHTTDIVPVDLNCLLYHLEAVLSKAYGLQGNTAKATYFQNKASARKHAILKYCWNEKDAFFMDYDFVKSQNTTVFSLAGIYPLYFKLANPDQALKVQQKVKHAFLQKGGLVVR